MLTFTFPPCCISYPAQKKSRMMCIFLKPSQLVAPSIDRAGADPSRCSQRNLENVPPWFVASPSIFACFKSQSWNMIFFQQKNCFRHPYFETLPSSVWSSLWSDPRKMICLRLLCQSRLRGSLSLHLFGLIRMFALRQPSDCIWSLNPIIYTNKKIQPIIYIYIYIVQSICFPFHPQKKRPIYTQASVLDAAPDAPDHGDAEDASPERSEH